MAKWSSLLRGFVPSWKFFDVAGTEFRLEARFGKNEESLGEWVNCLPPIRRELKNLTFNPYGNFLHACHNHLSHLNADILECEDAADLQSRATYRITRNMVEYQLKDLEFTKPPFTYQFRLLVDQAASKGSPSGHAREEALISSIYRAGL